MDLHIEINSIRERNKKVETDKAWEVSKTRIATIAIITYFAAALLLYLIGAERIWLGALVPVLGYYLSTQSLSGIKKWWVKKYTN